MKTIAFLLSHPSHQIATFNLAKKLINLDYEVIYVGPKLGADNEDLTHVVIHNGFKFKELDIYYSNDPEDHTEGIGTEAKLQRFISNLVDISIYKTFFSSHKIDLVVLDIFLAPVVIPMRVLDIRVVLASTIILADQDTWVAPLDHFFVPDLSPSCRIEVAEKWNFYLSGKKLTFGSYAQLLKKISELHHFDFDKYFYWNKSIVPFGFDYPELIFWDQAFDFPRSTKKNKKKFYLGYQVYTKIKYDRSMNIDDAFDKLVYVSLGTKDDTSNQAKTAFYHKIIHITRRHPDMLFVLSVPQAFIERIKSQDYDNIEFYKYCPQIEILKQANLMITHGGGSVKECIRMGVPMLCYPVDNDQHGNAARIVYHKLGLVGDLHQDSENIIEKYILHVLNNNSIRENILQFQQRAIAAEQGMDDVEIIERFLL